MKTETAVHLYVVVRTSPSHETELRREIDAKYVVAPLDLDGIRADGRLKDVEKIAADLAAKREKAVIDHAAAVEKARLDAYAEWRKSAQDGATGHVLSVAFAFGDGFVGHIENREFYPVYNDVGAQSGRVNYDHDAVRGGEFEVIETFFRIAADTIDDEAMLKARASWESDEELWDETVDAYAERALSHYRTDPTPVAHNAQHVLRFLFQRAIALGVAVPDWLKVDTRSADATVLQDTMAMWMGGSGKITLDRLGHALGFQGNGEVDAGVWDLVEAGEIEHIGDDAVADVELLRRVHKRLRGIYVPPVSTGVNAKPLPAGQINLRTGPELTAQLLATSAAQNAAGEVA